MFLMKMVVAKSHQIVAVRFATFVCTVSTVVPLSCCHSSVPYHQIHTACMCGFKSSRIQICLSTMIKISKDHRQHWDSPSCKQSVLKCLPKLEHSSAVKFY
jgi:hypothetical protein